MHSRLFQDELTALRDLGREFAQGHPDLVRYLGQAGADPDVERLFEGFAFLSARIREKLDDEFPELTHALLDAFFPHYLRPIPALTILRLNPPPLRNRQILSVPAGAIVDTPPMDGTACRFRTTWDTVIPPWDLTNLTVQPGATARLRLGLACSPDLPPAAAKIDRWRLHLAGDRKVATQLLALLVGAQRATVEINGKATAGGIRIEQVGLGSADTVLPVPGHALPAYALLQEYFAYPARFLFVDLVGFTALRLPEKCPGFDLVIDLQQPPQRIPAISLANLVPGCTPAINLFTADLDPFKADPVHCQQRIRAQGIDPRHQEVVAVRHLTGMPNGGRPQPFQRAFLIPGAAEAGAGANQGTRSFHERRCASWLSDGADHQVSLAGLAAPESISGELECTNGALPAKIRLGEIHRVISGIPTGVRPENITIPTRPCRPALAEDLHWRLLSHLSLSARSLASAPALRELFGIYDSRLLGDAESDRKAHQALADAVQEVACTPITRLLEGMPVRGLRIEIQVDSERLGGDGEMFLLGAVLDAFLARCSPMNSFTELHLADPGVGEHRAWRPRLGNRHLL